MFFEEDPLPASLGRPKASRRHPVGSRVDFLLIFALLEQFSGACSTFGVTCSMRVSDTSLSLAFGHILVPIGHTINGLGECLMFVKHTK